LIEIENILAGIVQTLNTINNALEIKHNVVIEVYPDRIEEYVFDNARDGTILILYTGSTLGRPVNMTMQERILSFRAEIFSRNMSDGLKYIDFVRRSITAKAIKLDNQMKIQALYSTADGLSDYDSESSLYVHYVDLSTSKPVRWGE